MTKILRGKGLVDGKARGEVLVAKKPLHLLGGVDAESGLITEVEHDLYGKSVAGKILVYPNCVGSSVGAYVIYKLKKQGKAPAAIVNSNIDIITASGCALAKVPLIHLASTLVRSIPRGAIVTVDGAEGTVSWNGNQSSG